jgi:hypothetical protein
MKNWTRLVAVMVVLGLASFASAKGARGGAKGGKAVVAKPLVGEITAVEQDKDKADNYKITVKPGAGKKNAVAAADVTVIADANTVITIDAVAGKAADLKVGMKVSVEPASGTATKIEAKNAPAGAAKGGKGAKGGKRR